jgi:uncharacterized membrane protein
LQLDVQTSRCKIALIIPQQYSNNSNTDKNKAQDQNTAVKNTTNNANTVSEQQTTKVQEQQVSYKHYGNARFGFIIEYPSDFKVKVVPDNGDGLIFQSALFLE